MRCKINKEKRKLMQMKMKGAAWRLATCLIMMVLLTSLRMSVDGQRRAQDRLYDAVVDIHGRGDYTTVQAAIDGVPINPKRQTPWKIFIKNGRYDGLVRIPEDKPFIYLVGQDKDSVIISFKINCANLDNPKDAGKQYAKARFNQADCAVVVVNARDFYAENISFENSYGVQAQSGPQALALKTTKDRVAVFNCRFRSFQDTWMTSTKGINDRTYADSCWIEGAVDYFYGGGDAYIENTTFYNVRSGSVIVAPSHKAGTKWGYVFQHCTIDGNAAAADGRSKLGRPWHDQPVAVFLNSVMKIPVYPEGWTDMGPAAKLFAEYNSRDAQGKPVDLTRRRTWYQQSKGEGGQRIDGLQAVLSKEQAAKYTYQNVISADDGWNPRAMFKRAAPPGRLQHAGARIRWQRSPEAVGYVVYKGDAVIGFTKGLSFTVGKPSVGRYRVRSVNTFGSLGELSAAVD